MMKHYYAARRGDLEVARLTLDWEPDMDPNFAFVKQVRTDPRWRRQGIAGTLLRRMLADADREGVELQLFPAQLDSLSPTLGQLMAWYRRHGFSPKGIAGGYWRRRPIR